MLPIQKYSSRNKHVEFAPPPPPVILEKRCQPLVVRFVEILEHLLGLWEHLGVPVALRVGPLCSRHAVPLALGKIPHACE